MFEVGQEYEFRMIEGGDEVLFWGDIEVYEHPIIKLRDHAFADPLLIGGVDRPPAEPVIIPGKIINVTSPNFISGVRHLRR
jgi:hypothetical protein